MEKYNYEPENKKYLRRIYIGNKNNEEFYIKPVEWACGWYWGGVYLEGLRPYTESTLRENASDREISEYYDVSNIPPRYLNEAAFQEEMENDWYEMADVQEEEEREGERYYLCFGTHTHADSVLLNECKGDYQTALNVFDKLVFTEEEFNTLIDILKRFYSCKERNQNNKKYLKEMKKAENILKELEQFLNKFSEFPNEKFWIDAD